MPVSWNRFFAILLIAALCLSAISTAPLHLEDSEHDSAIELKAIESEDDDVDIDILDLDGESPREEPSDWKSNLMENVTESGEHAKVVETEAMTSSLEESETTEDRETQSPVSTDLYQLNTTVNGSFSETTESNTTEAEITTAELLNITSTTAIPSESEVTTESSRQEEADIIKKLLGKLIDKLNIPQAVLNNYRYITAMKSSDGSLYVPHNHKQSTRNHLAVLLGFAEEIVTSQNALAHDDKEHLPHLATETTDAMESAPLTNATDSEQLPANLTDMATNQEATQTESTNVTEVVPSTNIDPDTGLPPLGIEGMYNLSNDNNTVVVEPLEYNVTYSDVEYNTTHELHGDGNATEQVNNQDQPTTASEHNLVTDGDNSAETESSHPELKGIEINGFLDDWMESISHPENGTEMKEEPLLVETAEVSR